MATQSAPHWGFCSLVLDAYVYQQEPANTPRKRLPRAELNARVLATILLLLSLYPLGFSKVHLQITKDRSLVSLGQKSPSTRAVNLESLLSRHSTRVRVCPRLGNVKLINTPPRNADSWALTWRSDGSSPLYRKYFKCVLVFKISIMAGQVQALSPSTALSTLVLAPHILAPHSEMLNGSWRRGEIEC